MSADAVAGPDGTEPSDAAGTNPDATTTADTGTTDDTDMELYNLRVTVDRIEGRSVCGMHVGDYIDVVNSNELRLPDGKHFCMYALQAVLPMLPAKQRQLPAGDWLEKDSHAACPDPEERLIMRIERTGTTRLRSEDLT